MIELARLPQIHDRTTALWHDPDAPSDTDVSNILDDPDLTTALLLQQHRANFDLWHQEDAARDPDASHRLIADTKHRIDALNQRRNDLTEQIDLALVAAAGPQPPSAPLHSESPGLIIDRLSILALKLFHTAEQVARVDVSAPHRERNAARLQILAEQRSDLAACLVALWAEVLAGRRRFKLYRQLKMYNDPTLNPVLYRRPPTP